MGPSTPYFSVTTTLPPVQSALLETIQRLWFADKVCTWVQHVDLYCLTSNTMFYKLLAFGFMLVCPEGDVRLVNQSYASNDGLNAVSGVVKVCVDQQYVYICADDWDDREADVVCRSLNYGYQAPYYSMSHHKA